MSLSNRKGTLGRLMCVLSLPLTLCGYADRPELEKIRSVQGAVVNESGYNYVLYRDIEYLGEGLREEKADLYLPVSFASDANQTYPVVMEIHGGGWAGGEKDWYLATSLAKELYLATPLSHVSSKTPPTLTIHGDSDKVVPFDQGARLHELLDEHSVENEFVRIKGGTHGFPIIPHEANCQTDSVQTLLDFLEKHLK